jgi:tRNA A37 threonylcarbamoyladenosine dehydratase
MKAMVASASTIITVDLIDEITMTAGPILAMTIGIDVIIDAMIDVTTIIAMTAATGATTTEVIVVMIAMMIIATTDETTDVMIDVARTTTVPVTTIGRSGLHYHHPKVATPMVHSRRPTARSTSSLEVAKRSKATDRLDQMPGRSGTSTPKTCDLCGGLNYQSLSPGNIIGFTSLTPEPIYWSLTP